MRNRLRHTLVLACVLTSAGACAHTASHHADAPEAAGQEPDAGPKRNANLEAELAEFKASAAAARADWFKPEQLTSGMSRTEKEGFVTLTGPDRRYRAFFGGLTEAQTGKITYLNADPELRVNSGFALGWGWRPFITTDRVTTATDGTRVLVQIDGDIHRIILLSGGRVRIETRPGDDECEPQQSIVVLNEPWTYVECTATDTDGDGVPCFVLSGSPVDVGQGPLRQFIREVLKRPRVKQLADE